MLRYLVASLHLWTAFFAYAQSNSFVDEDEILPEVTAVKAQKKEMILHGFDFGAGLVTTPNHNYGTSTSSKWMYYIHPHIGIPMRSVPYSSALWIDCALHYPITLQSKEREVSFLISLRPKWTFESFVWSSPDMTYTLTPSLGVSLDRAVYAFSSVKSFSPFIGVQVDQEFKERKIFDSYVVASVEGIAHVPTSYKSSEEQVEAPLDVWSGSGMLNIASAEISLGLKVNPNESSTNRSFLGLSYLFEMHAYDNFRKESEKSSVMEDVTMSKHVFMASWKYGF